MLTLKEEKSNSANFYVDLFTFVDFYGQSVLFYHNLTVVQHFLANFVKNLIFSELSVQKYWTITISIISLLLVYKKWTLKRRKILPFTWVLTSKWKPWFIALYTYCKFTCWTFDNLKEKKTSIYWKKTRNKKQACSLKKAS